MFAKNYIKLIIIIDFQQQVLLSENLDAFLSGVN